MEHIIQITAGYRITIPTEIRRKMEVKEGDFVIAKLEDHTMKIIPAKVVPKK